MLYFEGGNLIVDSSRLRNVVLMILRLNEIENVGSIVYFSVDQLSNVMSRRNMDLWSIFTRTWDFFFRVFIHFEGIDSFFNTLRWDEALYDLDIFIYLSFIMSVFFLRRSCIFLLTLCSYELLQLEKFLLKGLLFILFIFNP